ncbi:Nitrogen permease regulator 2 [Nowakowskiella sp. JEL0407]|nr:Nitrogen permease regulator 2 [Nowakowskiella sp. JEL0407]
MEPKGSSDIKSMSSSKSVESQSFQNSFGNGQKKISPLTNAISQQPISKSNLLLNKRFAFTTEFLKTESDVSFGSNQNKKTTPPHNRNSIFGGFTKSQDDSNELDFDRLAEEYINAENIELGQDDAENSLSKENLQRILNFWTLKFRSGRMEKEYIVTTHIRHRMIYSRLIYPLTMLFPVQMMIPMFFELSGVKFKYQNYSSWLIAVISIHVTFVSVIMFLTCWKKGSLYIKMYAGGAFRRFLIQWIENFALWLVAAYEITTESGINQLSQSNLLIILVTLGITSGSIATYSERIVSYFAYMIVPMFETLMLADVIKQRSGAILIESKLSAILTWSPELQKFFKDFEILRMILIYWIPIIIILVLQGRLIYTNDRERRVRYIKSKFVERKLELLQKEKEKTDYLLSLSLPKSIVGKLRDTGLKNVDLIAERIKSASVMFVDLKNIKEYISGHGSMRDAVEMLNSAFLKMDTIRLKFEGIEKIKTIGSKALFVGGITRQKIALKRLNPLLPSTNLLKNNKLDKMIEIAIWMRDYFNSVDVMGSRLDMGFGIDFGPLVAGIVGRTKFCYEIYGDVVNTASRMLSLTLSGDIIVTEKVWLECQKGHLFQGKCLGERYVKGKGQITVYSILGKAGAPSMTENTLSTHSSKPITFSLESLTSSSRTNRGSMQSDTGQVSIRKNQASIDLGIRPSFLNDKDYSLTIPQAPQFGHSAQALVPILEANEVITRLQELSSNVNGSQFQLNSPSGEENSGNQPHFTLFGSGLASPRFSIDATSIFGGSMSNIFVNNNNNSKEDEANKMKENASEAKELVRDVIEKMCDTVARQNSDSEQNPKFEDSAGADKIYGLASYMKEVNRSIKPVSLNFDTPVLEKQFRFDYNRETWPRFIKSAILGIFLQIMFVLIGLLQTMHPENPCPLIVPHPIQLALLFNNKILDTSCWSQLNNSSASFILTNLEYPFPRTVFNYFEEIFLLLILPFGIHLVYCGIYAFELGNQFEPQSIVYKLIMFGSTSFTTLLILSTVLGRWSYLFEIPYMSTIVLPSLIMVYILNIAGMQYIYRFGIITAIFVIMVILTPTISFIITFISTLVWAKIFHGIEMSIRVEYLMDLILDTQKELVEEETNKSAGVLVSILPERVILKLLANPNSIVFEEFSIMTVLHMDIAGFTSMSSGLEPFIIVKMLNTLFTYFDFLMEQNNVEKITTIGDAYVACSTPETHSEIRVGAITVCLVALQMQQYVIEQLNQSPIVLNNIGTPLRMRIGVNTGPGVGAILGGPTNFRYDLLGETVTLAEKVQEICPLSNVNVSHSTWYMVQDYHGFSFSPTPDNPDHPLKTKTYTVTLADRRMVRASSDVVKGGFAASASAGGNQQDFNDSTNNKRALNLLRPDNSHNSTHSRKSSSYQK